MVIADLRWNYTLKNFSKKNIYPSISTILLSNIRSCIIMLVMHIVISLYDVKRRFQSYVYIEKPLDFTDCRKFVYVDQLIKVY